MATSAAYTTFRRVYETGEQFVDYNTELVQASKYAHLWAMYSNSAFDDLSSWESYRARYGLYRFIRSIYNPARRLVDFYAGIVYPGVLTVDPDVVPDGSMMAIPFAEKTPAELQAAIAQLWQWSNWQAGKGVMVTYGAALGDCAIEIRDDPESGAVYLDNVWPGYIQDLDLDLSGNVKAYVIEYNYLDEETNRQHVYRKEVDAERIATYRDDKPWSYDGETPAEYENPYGFCPFVWIKHKDTGGRHGSPALRNIAALDELNSIASHVLDQDHRILESPVLIAGENIMIPSQESKEGNTSSTSRGRERINMLTGAAGASIDTMQLPEGEAMARIDWLAAQIEDTHPELTLYQRLREQSEVTGPGAERMAGDAAMYVFDARANYDAGSTRLFQMAAAIGGWRANSGAWGPILTAQQQKFLPFDLDSYRRGDLDLQIMPRPLFPMTPTEEIQYRREKMLLEHDEAGVQAGAQTMPQTVANRLRLATQQQTVETADS